MKQEKKASITHLIPQEVIENKIFLIRGKKVMLDRNLAILYEVPPKRLNEQVKRNIKRFPEDFMFQLTKEEADSLRSQFATLKRGQHSKYFPSAFTEHGILMLSSVLNSERAIQVNIQIMRTFTKLKEIIMTHKNLKRKIEDMERRYDQQFKVVFVAIKELLKPSPEESKRKIGFRTD